MHALAQPWHAAFMQRALLELLLVGLIGAAVGCWIAFYELAYSTESLAHALFPGLVAAALLGLPLLVGGAAGVLGAAAAVALAGRTPRIGADTAVAVVITSLFGLGVLLALSRSTPPGLETLLFGDLLGVSRSDLVVSGVLALFTLGAIAALHRPLLLVGFDRSTARAYGVRPIYVDLALLALVSVAVVVGVQALGNLLVIAMLVGPAATARLLSRRIRTMMVLAAAVASAASLAGLYLSYYADVAAGAAIAAVVVGMYLVALAARQLYPAAAASSSTAGTSPQSSSSL